MDVVWLLIKITELPNLKRLSILDVKITDEVLLEQLKTKFELIHSPLDQFKIIDNQKPNRPPSLDDE